MSIFAVRRRHRDGIDAHGGWANGGEAARGEPTICGADLGHVVGDDGGYDSADRRSNGAVGYYPRIGSSNQFKPRSYHCDAVCVGISSGLVRVQPLRYLAAMASRRSWTIIREHRVR